MRRRWVLLIELVVIVAVCVWAVMSFIDRTPRPANSVDLKVQLRDARDKAYLFAAEDGSFRYRIFLQDGRAEELGAEDFARRVYRDQHSRRPVEALLNVTSPMGLLWVTVGLLGQVLFTGRMVVQWLASEKKKESVVPASFWWMSLIGATMLLVYFLWRKDPVGVLGQGFGWFIYVRNLYLIHTKAPARATEDPGPEPELER